MSILRKYAGRIAFAGMRALGALKRALVRIAMPMVPAVSGFGRFLARWILLPTYRIFLMLRLRVGRIMLSARGLFFLIFANRYVFHGVVAALCLATIATQLQTRSATALDAGQRSLLYSLVTDGRESLVEETVRPELMQKDTHYLGAATIEPVPDIDFDYDYGEELPADLAVPGTIALLPGAEDPGQPGQPATRAPRTTIETYTVQPGDTISTIAQQFGVNIGTVLWANGLTERSLIRPGSTLKILPVSGVLHVVKKNDTLGKIANTYDADQEDILISNRLADAGSLRIGDELIIPGGTPPAAAPTPTRSPVATRPDVPIARIANKATDIYQELTGKADSRAKPEDVVEDAEKPKAKLLWPTRQRLINQYYGWKHTGVDIEGDYVDPIYASEDGTVETAGWNSGGYGLQIVINHGGGMKTRYAHASKLYVKAGDAVKRGETIAMVGTTGRSTGTHLHYEVYINNKRVNPLAYAK
ncbi:M23 family metallopeptidase [Patescibacteria group bacterium]|jgi:murein DD-endopeptidase MepM/ murein hydrolase activator NlpD|nr:M23 family metallopeptidase [Patescibacteria group bacterium]